MRSEFAKNANKTPNYGKSIWVIKKAEYADSKFILVWAQKTVPAKNLSEF